VRKFEDLPLNCQNYIKKIEELLGVDIDIISVSPDKEATIIRKELF
jgi:adenylosuccinate synthase